MHPHLFCRTVATIALLCSLSGGPSASGQTNATAPSSTNTVGKEVRLPPDIYRVPKDNDFNNPDSEFSFQRSKATDHFVLFWAKEYGADPMANPVENRRFKVDEILSECDRFYDYYVNTLKWVDKEKSYATKYKFLIFVIGGSGCGKSYSRSCRACRCACARSWRHYSVGCPAR